MLTEEQLAAWKQDGFLIVPKLFSAAETADITSWAEDVAGWPETPGTDYVIYGEEDRLTPGNRLLCRIENFCAAHPEFSELAAGARLAGIAGELFGEPAVLFKDKINFKLPGGGGFTPHQDIQAGWDIYAPLFITAFVSIDACTTENGCLEMAAGHHEEGMFGKSWEPLAGDDLAGVEFKSVQSQPGDAVFFDSNAPHQSQPNNTTLPRRALYLTYNPASDGDHRAAYYADKRASYPPDCERAPDKEYVFRV